MQWTVIFSLLFFPVDITSKLDTNSFTCFYTLSKVLGLLSFPISPSFIK
nr:MAG TPA: hypothetical protein [Siphoviridae sp. ctngg6]